MSMNDRVTARMQSELEQAERKLNLPPGWKPGVIEEDGRAVAVTAPIEDPDPSEAALLAHFGKDPRYWHIDGKVNHRSWQTYDERWLYYYKCDLVQINPEDHADVHGIHKRIQSRRPKPKLQVSDGLCGLLLIGDTQMGKGEGGGSPAAVDRILGSLDRTEQRLKDLLKRKVPIQRVAVAFMGDLIEGNCGNYAAQAYTTDLTRREQEGVMEDIVFEVIDKASQLAAEVDVLVVPGNHGENRQDGKLFTLPSDNSDIAVVERVHRGIRKNKNEAFDHVRFLYPESEELTVARDLCGVPVGFAHGHQYTGGATPQIKAEKWWKDQSFGETRVGSAKILFTAHYHHLTVSQSGTKTHIQIPALDGGSQWWENLKAQVSPPGIVSVLIGEGVGPQACGWDDLRVL